MNKSNYILIFFLLLFFKGVYSMDIRSMEIGYEKVSSLTYRAKITAYTFNAGPVDSTMTVSWGDNSSSDLSLQSTTIISNYLRKLEYSGTHTYPGAATYTISTKYFNRGGQVNNISGSANEAIYLEAEIVINPFLGTNSSPRFSTPPLDNACLNQPYIYDQGIVDDENDSIVVSATACMGKDESPIATYTFPDSFSGTYSIDPSTGIIIWDAPATPGRYNIAIRVREFRNGVFIGSTMRDMQLNVGDCDNEAPRLHVFNDTCVEAGGLLHVPAYTTDDTGDTLSISALGEIMNLGQTPGLFTSPTLGVDSAGDYFSWMPGCELVRKHPYQVVFIGDKKKAHANGYSPYINTFNNQVLGTDWYSTPHAVFTNPCPPSADGTPHLWMGDFQAHPRWVATQEFDLTSLSINEVHFDMKYATQGVPSPCEGPDLPDEGVHLQYSLDGVNGPWYNISYWDPSQPPPGGFNPMLTSWSHYSIPIPQSAISPNTRFRFAQFATSGPFYDHWGIDNFELFSRPENLTVMESVNILVIGPAPENLTATAVNQTIELAWNRSICPNATGYEIYRRASYLGYMAPQCEPGVPPHTGYKKIASLSSILDTSFVDDNNGKGINPGFEYCYMVTAIFPDGAESYPSLEACAVIDRHNPLITKVSVDSTESSGGIIDLQWTPPAIMDHAHQGPFKYLIYRAENSPANWTLIDSTGSINDTTYTDTQLNTIDNQYYYHLEFVQTSPSQRISISESPHASSPYLELSSQHKAISVDVSYDVSWNNHAYVVFKKPPGGTSFDSITTTSQLPWADTGLSLHNTYCYKVKTIGSYSESGIISPLFNFSQESCAVPVDEKPPDAPWLDVSVDCYAIGNHLRWTNPGNQTPGERVSQYHIYFSPVSNGTFSHIHTASPQWDTTWFHNKTSTVAGCYYVTAIDSSGNESAPGNTVCVDVDSCDTYRLPNVFTPNDDGINDIFRPFPAEYVVDRVHMVIFNRWGNVVYQTNDPQINWDGREQNSGRKVAEGVYFYVCDVYQNTLEGEKKTSLNGTIHLLR